MLAANIGVIAGIVFLAIEMQQNNELLRAQASFNRFSVERYRRTQITENAGGLAEIVYKKFSGETLSGFEAFRHNVVVSDLLDSLRWQFTELQAGRLPDNYMDLKDWRSIWRLMPELSVMMQSERENLDPEFIQYVIENIEQSN